MTDDSYIYCEYPITTCAWLRKRIVELEEYATDFETLTPDYKRKARCNDSLPRAINTREQIIFLEKEINELMSNKRSYLSQNESVALNMMLMFYEKKRDYLEFGIEGVEINQSVLEMMDNSNDPTTDEELEKLAASVRSKMTRDEFETQNEDVLEEMWNELKYIVGEEKDFIIRIMKELNLVSKN